MSSHQATSERRAGLARLLMLGAALLATTALAAAQTPGAAISPATWLTEAVRSPLHVSYRALETIAVVRGRTTTRQTVRITHRAPDDTRLEYLSSRRNIERIIGESGRVHWEYLPRERAAVFSHSAHADQGLWEQKHLDDLLLNYLLRDAGSTTVDRRPARLLEITPRAGHIGPSKRLWVDQQTHLILQSELTSSDHTTRLISSLSQLRLEQKLPDREFTPPRDARKQSVTYDHAAVLPLDALARSWRQPLLVPKLMPRGYELVSARLLRRGQQAYVHLQYFDGLNSISFFEDPSRERAPASRRGDDQIHGSPATWQFHSPFQSLSWRARDLKITLVGDLPRAELLRIARAVARR